MADMTQQQVVDYIKGISVLELSQLVKALETELGVSAAAAMHGNAGRVWRRAPWRRPKSDIHRDADRNRKTRIQT